MTNIRELKAVKTLKRNDYLLNIIKIAKDHIPRDTEMEDMMVIYRTKDGRLCYFGQSLNATSILEVIGMLDLVKQTHMDLYLQGENDEEI